MLQRVRLWLLSNIKLLVDIKQIANVFSFLSGLPGGDTNTTDDVDTNSTGGIDFIAVFSPASKGMLIVGALSSLVTWCGLVLLAAGMACLLGLVPTSSTTTAAGLDDDVEAGNSNTDSGSIDDDSGILEPTDRPTSGSTSAIDDDSQEQHHGQLTPPDAPVTGGGGTDTQKNSSPESHASPNVGEEVTEARQRNANEEGVPGEENSDTRRAEDKSAKQQHAQSRHARWMLKWGAGLIYFGGTVMTICFLAVYVTYSIEVFAARLYHDAPVYVLPACLVACLPACLLAHVHGVVHKGCDGQFGCSRIHSSVRAISLPVIVGNKQKAFFVLCCRCTSRFVGILCSFSR